MTEVAVGCVRPSRARTEYSGQPAEHERVVATTDGVEQNAGLLLCTLLQESYAPRLGANGCPKNLDDAGATSVLLRAMFKRRTSRVERNRGFCPR